jgi:hypothetical protein
MSVGIKWHPRDAHVEVVGTIRPHRHEGRRPQRDLTAVAHQYVHAQRGERHDDEGNQDGGVEVLAGQQRHADEGHRQQQADGNAVLRDRENLLVGAVSGLELAVFAVKHGVFLNNLLATTRFA